MEIKGEKSMICHSCNRQVNGKKKFNWLIFLQDSGGRYTLYIILLKVLNVNYVAVNYKGVLL